MITTNFNLNNKQIQTIAENFSQEIQRAIGQQKSSLKMLPSFFSTAPQNAQGQFIALDFGGTNVRVSLLELYGNGLYKIIAQRSANIEAFTSSKINADALFTFIANLISSLPLANQLYLLGHTFSFPSQQYSQNNAVLISWTKEFATVGVVGQNINQLLETALHNCGIINVKPIAIVNDTVATLIASSYRDEQTTIGSICGTGHNTALYDKNTKMILNMESGNFNLLPITKYDMLLDNYTTNPRMQALEKLVAGRYISELFRITYQPVQFPFPYSLTSNQLSAIIQGTQPGFDIQASQLAKSIVIRAARLVAATYLGALQYLDKQLLHHHTIAIDGSLYAKMPGYANQISVTVDELLGNKASQVTLCLENQGSSLGAALAAYISHHSQ